MERMDKKQEAILRLSGGKKLIKIGGSYALCLPKAWIDIFCYELEGTYWVRVDQVGATITLTPLDKKFVEEMLEANNDRVS